MDVEVVTNVVVAVEIGVGMARQLQAVEIAALSNEVTQLGSVGTGFGFPVVVAYGVDVALNDVDVLFEVVVHGLFSAPLCSSSSRTLTGATEVVTAVHVVIAVDLSTNIRG